MLLLLSVFFASAGQVWKYGGWVAVSFYAVLAFLFYKIMNRYSFKREHSLTFIFSLGIFAVFFFWVYPWANHGFGGGSDRDEGLVLACSNLVQGMYPYLGQTYLGNAPSVFPGAIFLALPFYFMGNPAFQNIFWLGVWYVYLSRRRKEGLSTIWFWGLVLFCPGILVDLITGGTLTAHAIAVTVSTLMVYESCHKTRLELSGWLWALLWGVTLSTKINFLLCAPVLVLALWNSEYRKNGFLAVLIGVLAWALITLPFWLVTPNEFVPFRQSQIFEWALPGMGIHVASLLGICAASLAMAWALIYKSKSEKGFYLALWLVQIIPVVVLTLLAAYQKALHPAYFSYAIHALFFAAAYQLTNQNPVVRLSPNG